MSKQRIKRGKQRRKPAAASAKQRIATSKLNSYEITFEPLREATSRRPPEFQEQIDELFYLLHHAPHQTIDRLLQLKAMYPDDRMLTNFLSAAYNATGNHAASRVLALENYLAHPDYLFAKIDYAQHCLDAGEFTKIPEIFNGKYDLQQLYPQRNKFHVSEYTGFMWVMCVYFSLIGKQQTAEIYYAALEAVVPDTDVLAKAKQLMRPSLRDSLRRWIMRKLRKTD